MFYISFYFTESPFPRNHIRSVTRSRYFVQTLAQSCCKTNNQEVIDNIHSNLPSRETDTLLIQPTRLVDKHSPVPQSMGEEQP